MRMLTVLLGEYDGLKSKIAPPNDMNYLEISIAKNGRWTYIQPKSHDVLWIMVFDGKLNDIDAEEGELIVFEEGSIPMEFTTNSGVRFILGSAKKFEHQLVLGRSSVHTSDDALENSMKKIESIHKELRRKKIIE